MRRKIRTIAIVLLWIVAISFNMAVLFPELVLGVVEWFVGR